MILVDTSVWIEHFRGRPVSAPLARFLEEGEVLVHPWVIGEVALGWLGDRRRRILGDLRMLTRAPVVADEEVLRLVEARRLAGRGIGWVDVQLLASALVAGSRLWTVDRRLAGAATELGLAPE